MHNNDSIKEIKLFSNNIELHESMLKDIENAKLCISMQTYRIEKSQLGQRFVELLAEKAKQGVEVILIVDSWGTGASSSFFKKLIENGGKLAIFNTPRLGTRFFTQSHRRNHRKLLVIDKFISYIGSSNITMYSKTWRELNVRIEGYVAKGFRQIIDIDYYNHDNYNYSLKKHSKILHFDKVEILRDIPNIYKQKVMKKFLYLISNAKESVYIETPYFLPGYRLRKALAEAVQRGVDVKIVMPRHSDVRTVDILRNHYLGVLYKKGIKIFFYYPDNLHSKLLLVDEKITALGSSNFDYRSFRYMHEVVMVSTEKKLLKAILEYKKTTILKTREFNYKRWSRRSLFEKIFAYVLKPFRFLF